MASKTESFAIDLFAQRIRPKIRRRGFRKNLLAFVKRHPEVEGYDDKEEIERTLEDIRQFPRLPDGYFFTDGEVYLVEVSVYNQLTPEKWRDIVDLWWDLDRYPVPLFVVELDRYGNERIINPFMVQYAQRKLDDCQRVMVVPE